MKNINDLKNERQQILNSAKTFLESDKIEEYENAMKEVAAFNNKIINAEKYEEEQNKFLENETTSAILKNQKEDEDGKKYASAFVFAMKNGITPSSANENEKTKVLYNALKETGGNPEGSDGGFLIPEEYNHKITEEKRQLLDLSTYFTEETVTALSGYRVLDTAANIGFTPIDEMDNIAEGDMPKFKKVSYSVKEYADIFPVSNNLLADEKVGLADYLARRFAKQETITKNQIIIENLKTLKAENISASNCVSEIKSVINKKLDPVISAESIIITNQSGLDFLDQLTDTSGRPLLQPDITGESTLMFKNKEVIMVSDKNLPSREVTTAGDKKGMYHPIFIGNGKEFMAIFKRSAIEVASTTQGGNAWATNSTEFRAIMRLDSQIMDEKAFVSREIFVPAT